MAPRFRRQAARTWPRWLASELWAARLMPQDLLGSWIESMACGKSSLLYPNPNRGKDGDLKPLTPVLQTGPFLRSRLPPGLEASDGR